MSYNLKYEKKPCPLCGQPKDRHSKTCNTCYMKARLTPEQIREHVNAKQRRLYQRNVDKHRAWSRDWYAAHKDECTAHKRTEYQKHPDILIERSKAYRQAHLEERRQKDHERYQRIKDDPAYKDKAHKRYERNKEHTNQRHRDFNRTPEGKAYFMAFRQRHQDSQELKNNKWTLLWDEYRACETCGTYTRREVDHIVERCNGGSDELDNLHVLCFNCHRKSGTGRHSHRKAVV